MNLIATLALVLGAVPPPAVPQSTCIVSLISPDANGVLTQVKLPSGKSETLWRFTWASCPGATRYHLFVIGPNAKNPIVNIDTVTKTSHVSRSVHFGITETQGWTWKVRAFVNGTWTAWSETRTFQVGIPEPAVRTTCSIRGRVDGRLQFKLTDDRGQPLAFDVKEMILIGPGSGDPLRARLVNRTFNFNDVPPGTYALFPAGFRGVAKHERTVSCVAGATLRENFRITASPRVD